MHSRAGNSLDPDRVGCSDGRNRHLRPPQARSIASSTSKRTSRFSSCSVRQKTVASPRAAEESRPCTVQTIRTLSGRWVRDSRAPDGDLLSGSPLRSQHEHLGPQGVPAAAGLPWGTTPDGELDRQGVVVGAIVATPAVFLTFPLGILGIVLDSMGLDRIKTNPIAARKFLIWSWISFVPGCIVGAVLLVWGLASLVT